MRGRLIFIKTAKDGWKACVIITMCYMVSSHLCVNHLLFSPSIILLQLKSFLINTTALREKQRARATELLLPASPKITYCLQHGGAAAVPLAAAFYGPVCTPPSSYFLCQSLSNIGTHSSHRRFSVREPDTILCTAIFFVIPHGGSVIFSTLLCLCGGFY